VALNFIQAGASVVNPLGMTDHVKQIMTAASLTGAVRGLTSTKTRQRCVVYVALMMAVFRTNGLAEEPTNETPTEADIAYITAGVLDHAPFAHRLPDDLLSTQFLDGYLDALDPSHLVFLQSDVEEFGWFRPDLVQMTRSQGDTWPAHMIFARYLRRLARQVSFETNLLQTAKFDFTGHDSWQPDRRSLMRPRDLNAAQALWQEEVRAEYLQEKLAGLPPYKIVLRLTQRYERRLQMMSQLRANDVLEMYFDAYAHAFDPHSDYFGHEEAQEFNTEINLSMVGIGGSLESRGGHWVIGELVPGGPAARSGLLHPGDRLLSVAQGDGEPEDVTVMPSSHVVALLRGPAGSTVRLTVIPAGKGGAARNTVSVVRENIRLTNEWAKASIIDLPQTNDTTCRVGVINLPSFYETRGQNAGGASADTARLIGKLKQAGITGLILDLRRNGGGSVQQAIWLTGLFIPAGPVVQTRDATGQVQAERSPGTNALYRGPLVVLTSRLSASAAEIVAGALQDYGRALVVGDPSTFGKGTIQTLVPLWKFLHYHGFGAVKVTLTKIYRPSGTSTQIKGVVPDINLPSETDQPGIGEALLPNALPWDTVPETVYSNLDLVGPVLATVRANSRARVASNPEFGLVREDLALLATEAAKPLSLNESMRRQENAKADNLQAEMNRARLANSARPPQIYEVTLANVESVELPPARKPSPSNTAAAQLAGKSPDADIELRETENILVDYVQALQARHYPGQAKVGLP